MSLTGEAAILAWAKRQTEGYPGVRIENFTTSWENGLAFCAIMHRYNHFLIIKTNN